MSKNKFVWLGYNTYVPYTDVLLLTDYSEPQTKKIVKKAKEENMLFDYSRGNGKATVCMLKDNTVIVTGTNLQEVLRSFEEPEQA
jgi:regulator of extracellular matrix RemA (YlzA/DUF370 family)